MVNDNKKNFLPAYFKDKLCGYIFDSLNPLVSRIATRHRKIFLQIRELSGKLEPSDSMLDGTDKSSFDAKIVFEHEFYLLYFKNTFFRESCVSCYVGKLI